ncbi:gustatory receptor for sugar taste 43a [Nomia melanderi]|uniref:gustatory receptor for sugar taste 43a n=1 Tax=Nomia melanderi TaxID=2448451 RepID=UPI003FCDB43D
MHVRWNDIDERNSASKSRKRTIKFEGKSEEKSNRRRDELAAQKNLCHAIFPIYYLGKVCGLIPVKFVVQADGKYQTHLTVLNLMYSLCVLVLLLGSEIWGLWRDLKDGWKHSTRLKSRTAVIATCSDVLGVMSLTVVCIGGSFFRWKYLQVVANKLIEVDEKFGVHSMKNSRMFTICITVCSLAYLWLNSGLDFYAWTRKTNLTKTMDDKGPINYAPLYFMYTVIISTELQYTVATYNVSQRFVKLNNSLKSLLNGSNPSPSDCLKGSPAKTVMTGDLREKGLNHDIVPRRQFELSAQHILWNPKGSETHANSIHELIMTHSSLCDTVSLINNTFGIVILAVTTSCLLHLVITPYFLILQAGEGHEWIFLAVQGMWCIFHVTRMLIIVQPSYSTVAEGKRTAVLVSQLLSSSYEANARHQLEIFSLQLLHRPLEFSVCGLFSLDRTLITSIAGAVTTYLVILIQFQNADETKGTADIIKNATQILESAHRFRT